MDGQLKGKQRCNKGRGSATLLSQAKNEAIPTMKGAKYANDNDPEIIFQFTLNDNEKEDSDDAAFEETLMDVEKQGGKRESVEKDKNKAKQGKTNDSMEINAGEEREGNNDHKTVAEQITERGELAVEEGGGHKTSV
eukprot:9681555-Ditylum_brightwellii.AAC.1